MSATDWTFEEQTVARCAFDLGNNRSIEVLINTLRVQTQQLDSAESIWQLHDYLSTERFEYEGRAQFDESNVLFILADMIKKELIAMDDLAGLDQKKVSKIKAMSMF